VPPRARTARRSHLWLDRFAPPLTVRRQALRLTKHAWHILRNDGLSAAIRLCIDAIGRYSRTGTLFEAIPAHAVPDAYATWLVDHPNAKRRPEDAARDLESLQQQPLISILMPVHNPPVDVLGAAIESVRRQSYPNWTLCAVNGG
jgi:hypothetical protein